MKKKNNWTIWAERMLKNKKSSRAHVKKYKFINKYHNAILTIIYLFKKPQ